MEQSPQGQIRSVGASGNPDPVASGRSPEVRDGELVCQPRKGTRLCSKPAGVPLEGRACRNHAVPSVLLRSHPGHSGCGLRPAAGRLETAVSRQEGHWLWREAWGPGATVGDEGTGLVLAPCGLEPGVQLPSRFWGPCPERPVVIGHRLSRSREGAGPILTQPP